MLFKLKNPQNGSQVSVSFRWSSGWTPILHALFSSGSGKQQPMTMHIRICGSTKFALDLNTGNGNLSEVNKINALIGHRACATWKTSACSVGSQWHCTAGLAEVDAHLSGTDSSTDSSIDSRVACVNTPTEPLSLSLATHHCPAPLV